MNNQALFAVEAHKLLENGQLQEALSICEEGLAKYIDYPVGYLVAVKAAIESEGIDRANQFIDTAKQFIDKEFVEKYLIAEVEKFTEREMQFNKAAAQSHQAMKTDPIDIIHQTDDSNQTNNSPIDKESVYDDFAPDFGEISDDTTAFAPEEIANIENLHTDEIITEELATEENVTSEDHDTSISEVATPKRASIEIDEANLNDIDFDKLNINASSDSSNIGIGNIDTNNINTINIHAVAVNATLTVAKEAMSDEDISNINWAALTADVSEEIALDTQEEVPEVVPSETTEEDTDLPEYDMPLYDTEEVVADELLYNEELTDYSVEEIDSSEEEELTLTEQDIDFALPQEAETEEAVDFDDIAIEDFAIDEAVQEEDTQKTTEQEAIDEVIEPESERNKEDKLGDYQKFASAMQDAFESTIYHQPEAVIPEIEFSAKFDGENPENNDISDEELVIQEVETNYSDEEQTYYTDYSEKYQGMRGFALKFMGKKAPGRKFQSERLNSLPGLNNTPSNISGGSCNMDLAYRPIPQEPAFNIDDIPAMELNNFSFVMDNSRESSGYVAGEEMEDYSASQDGSVAIVSDTMANILAMQGAYIQAIEMLEKLKSMYPDKTDEYQEKIDNYQAKIDK